VSWAYCCQPVHRIGYVAEATAHYWLFNQGCRGSEAGHRQFDTSGYQTPALTDEFQRVGGKALRFFFWSSTGGSGQYRRSSCPPLPRPACHRRFTHETASKSTPPPSTKRRMMDSDRRPEIGPLSNRPSGMLVDRSWGSTHLAQCVASRRGSSSPCRVVHRRRRHRATRPQR